MERGVSYTTLLQLERARELIAQRLDYSTSLSEAAREACLSPYHFHRLFSRTYSQTPHEFLSSLRLEHAKKMLVDTDLSVTEICFSLGYESLGSFSTKFQRIVGCSPTQFRLGTRRYWAISRIRAHRFVPSCYVRRVHNRALLPNRSQSDLTLNM